MSEERGVRAQGRTARRTRRGAWLAILGPDGSGKSSVLDGVEREIGDRFADVHRYHLRPHGGRRYRPSSPVTAPHAQPPRGGMASTAKLAWWWVDYWTGYWGVVRPAVRAGALVLFDRYLDDLIVDPLRYRYDGPERVVEILARTVPRPDALVVLDAPVEVLRRRKQEVGVAELARQREQYRRLAEVAPEGRYVNAAHPLQEVVSTVCAIVGEVEGSP